MGHFKLAKLFDADGDLSKRWFVYYSYVDPITAKFKRFREMLPTKAKSRVERYAAGKMRVDELNIKLKEGWNPFSTTDPGSINIIEAIDKLKIEYKSLRQTSWSNYNAGLSRLYEFCYQSEEKLYLVPISYFNFQHAQKFMEFYKETHNPCNYTYNIMAKRMKRSFNRWIAKEWIITNPFKNIPLLTTTETELVGFTEDELKIVKENLPGYNYDLYIYIGLIFYCFLRPREIQRLQIYNMNLSKGFISVPGKISKNKKDGIVNIPQQFLEDLKKFDLDYPKDYVIFSNLMKRGVNVIAPQTANTYWKNFGKKYGINKPKYALKHTGNGLAVQSGISVRDLQLHNRHSSLEMTQKYLDRFSRNVSEKIINNFPSI